MKKELRTLSSGECYFILVVSILAGLGLGALGFLWASTHELGIFFLAMGAVGGSQLLCRLLIWLFKHL